MPKEIKINITTIAVSDQQFLKIILFLFISNFLPFKESLLKLETIYVELGLTIPVQYTCKTYLFDQEEPYAMIKPEYSDEVKKLRDNGSRVCGTHYFLGFCIDLAQKVAEKINMTYDICLVQDGMYGAELADKSWNGMIGELLEKVSYF